MEGSWKLPVTEAELSRIAAGIDRQGYAVLKNYVSEEELKPARNLALSAVKAAGGEYACLPGHKALDGTVLAELPRSDAFQNVCRRLYELGTKTTAPDVQFYQILRCLQGVSGQRHSYRFHYDSYVLTALLPVAIPSTGAPGNLLIIPSTRRIRHLYLLNVLDKVLIDNPITQRILRRAAHLLPKTVAVPMEPGNMYFFWGYRSVHTNEPCDSDKLRATALFHYGDPHQDSRTRALIRRTTAAVRVIASAGLSPTRLR